MLPGLLVLYKYTLELCFRPCGRARPPLLDPLVRAVFISAAGPFLDATLR